MYVCIYVIYVICMYVIYVCMYLYIYIQNIGPKYANTSKPKISQGKKRANTTSLYTTQYWFYDA